MRKRLYYKPEEVENMRLVREMVRHAKEKYPYDLAYRQIESKNTESSINFRGLNDNMDALGTALLHHGFQEQHIALLGETSVEWITSYLAIVSGVGVAVPIDKELAVETMAKQLNFADINTIFCSKKCLKKLKKVLPLCPEIKTLVIMRSGGESDDSLAETVLTFEDLLDEGSKLVKSDRSFIDAEVDPNKMSQLVFTSGTTGANKAVMLSNSTVLGASRGFARLVKYKKTSFSVLPINHTYELTCHILSCIYEGTCVCINDDLKHVMQNLAHFAPEMTCMVPMMLDLIVRRIKNVAKETGLEAHINYGIRVSNILMKFGIDCRKKFFAPALDKFGGNLNKIICGGAPLSQETIDYLTSIGIDVFNGYGITECSPGVAVNADACRRSGSIGVVLPTCQVRIVNPDETGNGEIQIKGDMVMLGYYKMPEDTAAVFTEDGWFRTGDIGHVDKDNFLFMTGRLKNLIILSNGKNVSPEEVEETLQKQFEFVEECVVFADEDCTGIYAICYLNPDYCAAHGLDTPEAKLEHMQQARTEFNKKVPSFKRLTDIEISETPFEKTTTHKIQRFKVLERRKQNV